MSDQEARTLCYITVTNRARSRYWHNGKEWSLSDWGVALAGEVGEACDCIKKINRLRDGLVGNKDSKTIEEYKKELGKELADVFLYLDLLAEAAGIELEEVIVQKFNEVSERTGHYSRL